MRSRAATKKSEREFAKHISKGASQKEAYKKTFKTCADITAQAASSGYAKRPRVKDLIEQYTRAIEKKDVASVVNNITKDAIRSKKTVIYNSKGDKTTVEDNSATVSNRELLFKLAGHPSFNKQVNVQVNNTNVPDGLMDKIASALDKLDAIAGKLGTNVNSEFVDAEFKPSGD
jgi:hypothetical protein